MAWRTLESWMRRSWASSRRLATTSVMRSNDSRAAVGVSTSSATAEFLDMGHSWRLAVGQHCGGNEDSHHEAGANFQGKAGCHQEAIDKSGADPGGGGPRPDHPATLPEGVTGSEGGEGKPNEAEAEEPFQIIIVEETIIPQAIGGGGTHRARPIADPGIHRSFRPEGQGRLPDGQTTKRIEIGLPP